MQPKQFCHFLTVRLEKSIVLHVLKNALVNLFLRKEESYSEKFLMTSCFDEGLMGGIFLCIPHENLHKYGQILNMSKICVHVMEQLSKASHLIMTKMLLALGMLQVGAAIACQNYELRQKGMIFLVLPFLALLDQGRANRKLQDAYSETTKKTSQQGLVWKKEHCMIE